MKALTLTFALLLLCTGAVLAQTPDGQTPAAETVCDEETGAAFGLCNAYCEAMDCDSDSPQASGTACTKVRDKFMNIAGHDLPCEAPPCPCQTLRPGFDAVLAGNALSCGGDLGVFFLTTDTGSIFTADADSLSEGFAFCGLSNDQSNFLSITLEEGQACLDLLSGRCP